MYITSQYVCKLDNHCSQDAQKEKKYYTEIANLREILQQHNNMGQIDFYSIM